MERYIRREDEKEEGGSY